MTSRQREQTFHGVSLTTMCAVMTQLAEQGFCLHQIARVEALAEPAIYRSEKLAGLILLALIAPQLRYAHRDAEFPGLRLLSTRDGERARSALPLSPYPGRAP
jgi:hypothetical protein